VGKHRLAFVAFDRAKEKLAVATADDGRDGEVRYLGEIENSADAVRKLVAKLSRQYERLHFCYEAGPTGYGLHRQLTDLGHVCDVVAPTMIPKRSNDRVKTLVKLLRAGELRAVRVPDIVHEAVRDLTRARGVAMIDLKKKRQQLLSFVLRHNPIFPGWKNWTKMNERWLAKQTFDHPAQQVVFQDQLEVINIDAGRRSNLLNLMKRTQTWLCFPTRSLAGINLRTRQAISVPLVIRLGIVLGPILVGLLLLTHAGPAALKPAAVTTSRDTHARADAQTHLRAGLVATTVIPPAETKVTFPSDDSSGLGKTFLRGVDAMETKFDDDTRRDGARLVNAAARLGYEPARALITQRYPSSSILRSTVSSQEAVQYSLDPLFIPGPQSESNRFFMVLLASYFSGRHELDTYVADLLEALSGDRRLQTKESLKSLLDLLARVHGACIALAQAVVKARMVAGPECSTKLQLQMEHFVHSAAERKAVQN
jgi:hypothetical protein